MLVLDSGAVSRLSSRSRSAAALIGALIDAELWPPVVPTMVLVESLHGHPGRDAAVNLFLRTCTIESIVGVPVARRAAELRRLARRGSAVDALVVATADPGGTVLTGDIGDLGALAAHADGVTVERI